MLIVSWLLGATVSRTSSPWQHNSRMDDSLAPPTTAAAAAEALDSSVVDMMTDDDHKPMELNDEPIMDASYLDDEINTVNDEFSSWKLTLHNNHHIQHRYGRSNHDDSSALSPLLLYNRRSLFNVNNNNNEDSPHQSLTSDLQHCETIASITGSILDQLDFSSDDFLLSSVMTPTTTTNTSESSSGAHHAASSQVSQRTPLPLLFSPTRAEASAAAAATTTTLLSTFSTDSLDKSLFLDKLTRCMNHDQKNYTIAFPDSSNHSSSTNSAAATTNTYKTLLTQSCPSWKILEDITSSSSMDKKNNNRRLAEILTKTKEIQTSNQEQQPLEKLIVCYPNYVLPDLQFLHKRPSSSSTKTSSNYVLHPREFKSPSRTSSPKIRPLSLNDVDAIKVRKEKVTDWESLEFLLPSKFKKLISTIDKPLEEREKNDPNEKEQDESSAGGTEVKYRSQQQQQGKDPRKRYSMGSGAGDSRKLQHRHKRFSLQEIEEITEMTRDIDSALLQFSKLQTDSQQQQQQQPQQPPQPPTNTPTSFLSSNNNYLLEEKAALTGQVTWSVTLLTSPPRGGSSKAITSVSTVGKQVVESLCPALYSLLSDGLVPHIDTIFGRVPNTLWRVIEASIQTGPTSQSLSELVLRINSEEDLMPEGPLKFNAFIVGLLNLRSLSSWLTFLRTKDRLLRVHYSPGSLMYMCNTGGRGLYDQMLANTLVLSKQNYTLDIFHETKMLLHRNKNKPTKKISFMKRSFSDERPTNKQQRHHHSNLPKSKTQILRPPTAKYFPPETTKVDKFKKLQLQWEMLASSRDDNSCHSNNTAASTPSRIPRPIVAVVSPTTSNHGQQQPNVRPSSAFPNLRLK